MKKGWDWFFYEKKKLTEKRLLLIKKILFILTILLLIYHVGWKIINTENIVACRELDTLFLLESIRVEAEDTSVIGSIRAAVAAHEDFMCDGIVCHTVCVSKVCVPYLINTIRL